MAWMDVVFRMLNKAGTDFVEPATADKQLLNGHDVTVLNPTADPETGLAKDSKQLPDGHNVSIKAGVPSALNTSTSFIPTVVSPYVGSWELNDSFTDVMVTMSCDVSGSLFFEFYDNNDTPTVSSTPTSTFPVTGYVYVAPFNAFHQATKGPRWFRVRFVPASTSTTFRINSYFVAKSQGSLPLNQSIRRDQDSSVVRAVLEGNVADDLLNPTDTFEQPLILSNKSLSVGLAPKILIDQNVAIPSGAAVVIHPVLNVEANVYDSGWLASSAYHSQLAHIKVDGVCKAYLLNSPDTAGTGFSGGLNPFATTAAGSPTTGGSMFFQSYFRLVLVNTSGSVVSGHVESVGHFTQLGPLLIPADAPVFDFFPAPLGQSITKGKTPDGDYSNQVLGGTKTLTPTPTVLGVSGVYTSTVMDTERYPTIFMLITADQASAPSGILFEWSDTLAFTTVRSSEPYTFRQGNITAGMTIPTRTRARYLRFKYTNGLIAQGRFFLNLRLSPTPLVQEVSVRSSSAGGTNQQDVTLTASQVATGALPGRTAIRLTNLSSSARPLFYGFSIGLTTGNGDELASGQSVAFDLDQFVSLYVITTSTGGGGVRCAWTEVA